MCPQCVPPCPLQRHHVLLPEASLALLGETGQPCLHWFTISCLRQPPLAFADCPAVAKDSQTVSRLHEQHLAVSLSSLGTIKCQTICHSPLSASDLLLLTRFVYTHCLCFEKKSVSLHTGLKPQCLQTEKELRFYTELWNCFACNILLQWLSVFRCWCQT